MKSRILYLIIYVCLLPLVGCNVHEWPDLPENVQVHLQLRYDTDWTMKEYEYESRNASTDSKASINDGVIRYIIRPYPLDERQRAMQEHVQEYVITKNIIEGYNHDVTLDLLPGKYHLMVWSDMVRHANDAPFYYAGNFAEITLQGEHAPNNNYRDAFRGSRSITLVSDIYEHAPDTLTVQMQRPLAKFEFVTTDVEEFIEKETLRIQSKGNADGNVGPTDPSSRANIDDYRVKFFYVGFMPVAYSLFTDKPVDSTTGVFFESNLKKLNENEASLGFDHVFVNGTESSVTVKIGIYDKEGTELSVSESIQVPLKRSQHTVMRGMFLMSEASGGVSINPEFDGDHNLIFP